MPKDPTDALSKLRELVEKIRHVSYNEIFPLVEELKALLPALEQLQSYHDIWKTTCECHRVVITDREEEIAGLKSKVAALEQPNVKWTESELGSRIRWLIAKRHGNFSDYRNDELANEIMQEVVALEQRERELMSMLEAALSFIQELHEWQIGRTGLPMFMAQTATVKSALRVALNPTEGK